jgi:phage shock protein C
MDEKNFPNIFEEYHNGSQNNFRGQKRLEKSKTNVIVAGVCAGVAKYLKIDTSLVRLFAVLSLLFGVWVIAVYFVAAFVMPGEYVFSELTGAKKKIQKRENYKTVTGSLLMLAGMYMLLDSLGFILFRIPFLPSGRFLLPFISVIAGAYFISLKEGKLHILKEKFPDKFLRSRSDRYLMGVCGGFAKYINAESATVRIVFIAATFLTLGFFAIVYLFVVVIVKMERNEIAVE